MAYVVPPLPRFAQEEAEDRLRWSFLIMAEAKKCGLEGLRVGRRIDGSNVPGATNWLTLYTPSSFQFHLRTVLPNQIAFDLGDNLEDGSATPWPTTAAYANAVMDACTALEIPFHAGLSGGKGFHVEVFLDPAGSQSFCADGEDKEWRRIVAGAILAKANSILFGDAWSDEVGRQSLVYDKLFIAPPRESNLFREYGERKANMATLRKLLWHEGQGPAPRVPDSKEEAYRQATALAKANGRHRPLAIHTAEKAAILDTRWVMQMEGKPCPQGPQCYELDESGWSKCQSCPAGAC